MTFLMQDIYYYCSQTLGDLITMAAEKFQISGVEPANNLYFLPHLKAIHQQLTFDICAVSQPFSTQHEFNGVTVYQHHPSAPG